MYQIEQNVLSGSVSVDEFKIRIYPRGNEKMLIFVIINYYTF